VIPCGQEIGVDCKLNRLARLGFAALSIFWEAEAMRFGFF
jgi:hypothetical protein